MAVYFKLMCNDIVLLRPTVDVSDANVCYRLQVFQSLICRWHARLYHVCLICFKTYFYKDGIHTLLQMKYIYK